VIGDRQLGLACGYTRVTRTPLRFSSLTFIPVRCSSLSADLSAIERALTAAHSRSPEHNLRTRQFPACQGWGRGFESLRPLQVLSDRSRGSATAFCVSGVVSKGRAQLLRLPAGQTHLQTTNLGVRGSNSFRARHFSGRDSNLSDWPPAGGSWCHGGGPRVFSPCPGVDRVRGLDHRLRHPCAASTGRCISPDNCRGLVKVSECNK
jgi:hypothetical protein